MSHVINEKDRNSKVKARKKENVTVYNKIKNQLGPVSNSLDRLLQRPV